MILEVRAVHPFFKNGYVVGCEETRDAVVIDPGDEVDQLLEAVKDTRAAGALHTADPRAPRSHHRRRAREGCAWRPRRSPPGRQLSLCRRGSAGESLRLRGRGTAGRGFLRRAGATMTFGSRQGSRASYARTLSRRRLPGRRARGLDRDGAYSSATRCSRGLIGRTDLPGGDMTTLLRSIQDVLFTYSDESVVYSGHGEPTTIGRERRTNPFLR